MTAPIQTVLKQGILSGILGLALVMVSSPKALSNFKDQGAEGSLWTFTVDQCANDDQAPEVQQVPRSGDGIGAQGGAEKGCLGQRSHTSTYAVFPPMDDGAGQWSSRPWRRPVRRSPQNDDVSPRAEPYGSGNGDSGVAVGTVEITERHGHVKDLQVQALPGAIQFQYTRYENCCAHIELVPTQRGQVLELWERELPTSSACRCGCPMAVSGTMDDLPPGTYTLLVRGYYSQFEGPESNRVRVQRERVLFTGTVRLPEEQP